MGVPIDLTGQLIGRWKVLYKCDYKSKSGHTLWHCKCTCEDGTERDVDVSQLTRGRSKSCGCLTKEKARENNFRNIVGEKFGKLTAIKFLGFKNRRAIWHCICDCDNHGEIDVAQDRLVSGNVSSCGCLKKHKMPSNFIDMKNKRYGNLVAIEYVGHINNRTYWKFRCDCGNKKVLNGDTVRRGNTLSCGCIDIAKSGSQSENEIKTFILDAFPKLKIEKSRILDGKEIDIYIPELKIGIEYNGSAYHASENNIYNNKNRYYHRDKFLLAKSKGIHLITVFDKDYEENKYRILDTIHSILVDKDNKFFIPRNDIEYTNNDYDTGEWLKQYGYKEVGQEEPESFTYKDKFLVYRCGRTKWLLNS